ncbi:unnamed protein product [Sympodiomycopsis kandeliae]
MMRPSLSLSLSRLSLSAAGPSVASSSRLAIAPAVQHTTKKSVRFAPLPCSTPAATRGYASEANFGLNNIGPLFGKKNAKRLGRGSSSGRGGTSTRGHKGQKARRGNGKPVPGFSGGQAPITRTFPKRGFVNAFAHDTVPLNIGRVQEWIEAGRLDASKPITIRELYLSRCIHQTGEGGIKLLAQESSLQPFSTPINIVVSRASASAIKAVERSGGSITCKYYTPLSIRACIKPEKWTERGRLVPEEPLPIGKRDLMYYTDIKNRGYLAKMSRNGTLSGFMERFGEKSVGEQSAAEAEAASPSSASTSTSSS